MHQVQEASHSYIYVFVRQDISLAQQLVQSSHAVYSIAQQQTNLDKNTIPSIVMIGVPNSKALNRVITKLQLNNIEHATFFEPDFNMGLSAVATAPLYTNEERAVLKNYCTWKEPGYVSTKQNVKIEGELYD